jgi:tellurite resistance protein TerC
VILELGRQSYKLARRITIAVIGGTVILAGVIMLVTPGPALIVIPTGLAILALEFAWAKHWLARLKASLTKEQLNGLMDKTRRFAGKSPPPAPPAGD